MQVPAARRARLEVSGPLERQGGLVGGAEIRRSAQQPRNVLRKHVEHFARRIPSGDALGIRRKDRKPGIPSGRQLTPLHQVDLGREFRISRPVSREELSPTAVGLRAARANSGGEMFAHAVGNQELGVFGPSVVAFGEANLLLTQRLAMSGGGILLMRRAVTDMAVENDESWEPLGLAKGVESLLDPVYVIGVAHAQDVPAITHESRSDVLRKGDARVAFDRDVVVVVDP